MIPAACKGASHVPAMNRRSGMFWLSKVLAKLCRCKAVLQVHCHLPWNDAKPGIYYPSQSQSKNKLYTTSIAGSASHQAANLAKLTLLAFCASSRLPLHCQRALHCKDWHSAWRQLCVASVPCTMSCMQLCADIDLGPHGAPPMGTTKEVSSRSPTLGPNLIYSSKYYDKQPVTFL